MTITFQLVAALYETMLLYGLVAAGFYLASIGCRHFCFAGAASFVSVPYMTLSASNGTALTIAVALALAIVGLVGVLYRRASASLIAGGAREGPLLVLSLAAMALVENSITLVFGGSSRTVASFITSDIFAGLTFRQFIVVTVGTTILTTLVVSWRGALAGKLVQALIESRLNLALRGWSISAIETILAAAGFACLGAAGFLWAFDGRIKPAMCTEVAIVGAVSFIVGSMSSHGVRAVIGAAAMLAVARFGLSVAFEGDWSMTAVLLLLLVALVLRPPRSIRVEADL